MDMSWSRMSGAMSSDVSQTRGLLMAYSVTLTADDRVPTVFGEVPPTLAPKALDVVGTKLVALSQGLRLTS